MQIRLETHVVPEHDAVRAAVAQHGVDYIVFNNHLPEAVDLATSAPDKFASWAAQHRLTATEMMQIVRGAQAQEADVEPALAQLAARSAQAVCGWDRMMIPVRPPARGSVRMVR